MKNLLLKYRGVYMSDDALFLDFVTLHDMVVEDLKEEQANANA